MTDQTITGLTAADSRAFEVALAYIQTLTVDSSDHLSQCLSSIMNTLAAADSLGKRERDRRLTVIITALGISEKLLTSIAMQPEVEALGFTNVFMTILPPAKRRKLFSALASGTVSGAARRSPPDQPTEDIRQLTQEELASPFRSVVLLGSESEHTFNSRALKENSFTPLRLPSLDIQPLHKDICGIIVAGSIWSSHNPTTQRKLIEELCSLTSILFLRIDINFLDELVAAEIPAIQHRLFGQDLPHPLFCQSRGCDLTPSDIQTLARTAELLEASQASNFFPMELDDAESFLLRVAITKYIRGSNPVANTRIRQLKAGFIPGGKSGARVAILRPDDGGLPVVAKFDQVNRLRQEIALFNSHIKRWEDRVRPELHSHLGKGLLLYNLARSASDPMAPAPTLEDRLSISLNSEIGDWGETPPLENDIKQALTKSSARLRELSRRTTEGKTAQYDWIADSVKRILSQGISWKIYDISGNLLDIESIVNTSIKIVNRLPHTASSHGDIHLRNILLSDDREPIFIDFAYCGPGHPCYDLARLDSAVRYRAFRMLCDESSTARLLHAVLLNGTEYEDLCQGWPALTGSIGNRLSIHTSLQVRKDCLSVLREYDGDLIDFLAMQSLLACHALTMSDQQSGVARAAIAALSEAFKAN